MEIDLMHVGCLGIVQYLLGNVLHELFVEMGGTSTNWKETCGHLNMLIKQAARKLDKGPPVNQLTLNMMKSGAKAPKLKAKAAESRHMLAAVCKLLETYLPPKKRLPKYSIQLREVFGIVLRGGSGLDARCQSR